MRISELAVNRPVTTLMLVLIIIMLGVVSLGKLTIDLFPDITLPIAVVYTEYQGVGPQEIESMITKPIEEAVATVSNVESISSTSSVGLSMVVVEFNWGTDMDAAQREIKEKLDLFEYYLPDDAQDPIVFKYDPSLMPIILFGISGDMDQRGLKNFAEDVLKERLERIEGVATAEVHGGLEREIKVIVDQEKLQGYGISLNQVVQALRMENINLSGGSVQESKKELIVRTVGEFKDIGEIENVVINTSSGSSVRLKEIAQVVDGHKKVDSYNRMDGEPSIVIAVRKQTDANTVKVADKVTKELEKIQKNYPVKVNYVFNQADFIKRSMNNLYQNAVFGAILAVFVLLLFLRNLRTTLIIGVAIPISVIATFILVHFAGLTLNMMSMGGLALGVGMLVDSSIVVLENIYRFREEGYSRIEAAKYGSGEVGMAVTASTLTTVAVFLPIVYVEGLAARLFRELAMTVSFSLFASLAVALTLVPMVSSRILKVSRKENSYAGSNGILTRLSGRFEAFFKKLETAYIGLLRWALLHRKIVVAAAIILFVASIALLPLIGMEFIPKMDEGVFTVDLKLPNGTALDVTDGVVRKLEDTLRGIPEVKTVFGQVGFVDRGPSVDSGPERGSLYVKLKDLDQRERSIEEIMEEVRQKVSGIPDADIKVTAQSTMNPGNVGGAPINIKIKGDDFGVLKQLSERVANLVEQVRGTREVDTSLREGRPEVRIRIDRDKASRYGLTTSQIAATVETAVKGSAATKFRVAGEEVDIRVELERDRAEKLKDLYQLTIASPMGVHVPLEEVADIVVEKGPSKIDRENQERIATVTSQIFGRDLGSITREIHAKLETLKVPEGYRIEFGGEREEMIDAFKNLALAFVLAVALVYMILASQFESLIHPFTIMFSVPLALIGVTTSLFVTGRTLNVPSIIGIIMLAGIVVNNAIVLIDYINRLRNQGLEMKEAVLKAGPIRLRPILMTALTTILALMPLALGMGEGAEVRAPMATVVIGGLTFSTILTLVIIPVIYTVFDDLGNRIITIFRRGKGKPRFEKEGV